MSHHGKPAVPLHEGRVRIDARENYLQVCGPAAAFKRAQEIERLPTVDWKGQTLFTLQCHGDYGQGLHLLNVPESLLWNLISLERFFCPYHR